MTVHFVTGNADKFAIAKRALEKMIEFWRKNMEMYRGQRRFSLFLWHSRDHGS